MVETTSSSQPESTLVQILSSIRGPEERGKPSEQQLSSQSQETLYHPDTASRAQTPALSSTSRQPQPRPKSKSETRGTIQDPLLYSPPALARPQTAERTVHVSNDSPPDSESSLPPTRFNPQTVPISRKPNPHAAPISSIRTQNAPTPPPIPPTNPTPMPTSTPTPATERHSPRKSRTRAENPTPSPSTSTPSPQIMPSTPAPTPPPRFSKPQPRLPPPSKATSPHAPSFPPGLGSSGLSSNNSAPDHPILLTSSNLSLPARSSSASGLSSIDLPGVAALGKSAPKAEKATHPSRSVPTPTPPEPSRELPQAQSRGRASTGPRVKKQNRDRRLIVANSSPSPPSSPPKQFHPIPTPAEPTSSSKPTPASEGKAKRASSSGWIPPSPLRVVKRVERLEELSTDMYLAALADLMVTTRCGACGSKLPLDDEEILVCCAPGCPLQVRSLSSYLLMTDEDVL